MYDGIKPFHLLKEGTLVDIHTPDNKVIIKNHKLKKSLYYPVSASKLFFNKKDDPDVHVYFVEFATFNASAFKVLVHVTKIESRDNIEGKTNLANHSEFNKEIKALPKFTGNNNVK